MANYCACSRQIVAVKRAERQNSGAQLILARPPCLPICVIDSGEVLASSGMMNPQIRFGEDLMSRVSYGLMNEVARAG